MEPKRARSQKKVLFGVGSITKGFVLTHYRVDSNERPEKILLNNVTSRLAGWRRVLGFRKMLKLDMSRLTLTSIVPTVVEIVSQRSISHIRIV